RITVAEQVTLAPAATRYEPLIAVPSWPDGAGVVSAWPGEPLYDQLDPDQAARLRDEHINLEDPWSGWEPAAVHHLEHGEDFDAVILAIPIEALRPVCRGIAARDARWQAMFDNVVTTATQAIQLWLRPSLEELGLVAADWGLPGPDQPVSAL